MENASKALIMAAGMLIGIMIASLFVYEMNYVAENKRVYDAEAYLTQVTEFNQRFEKYVTTGVGIENDGIKNYISAHDVATLCGYISQWNSEHISNSITFTPRGNATIVNTLRNIYNGVPSSLENFLDNNYDMRFKCSVEYDDNPIARRVNRVIVTGI